MKNYKMKRLKEAIEHDKEMYHGAKTGRQRTSWDGLILIGVSLVALLVNLSLCMWQEYCRGYDNHQRSSI